MLELFHGGWTTYSKQVRHRLREKGRQYVFDRPTRFTPNSLYVRLATKMDLTAIVEFKEDFGAVPASRKRAAKAKRGQ